jgi:hypothetical protein
VVPRTAWNHRGAFIELVAPPPALLLRILHHPIGSVSKVEIVTLMDLIYKVLFPSISTFETPSP